MAVDDARLEVRRTCLSGLTADEAAAWRGHHARSAWPSPLTSLAFARLTEEAFGDVEVVIGARDGRAVFFLPYHRRANRFARPLGRVFSDIHGPVTAPGCVFDGAEILRRAGLSGFRFHGLEDASGPMRGGVVSTDTAYSIVLDSDPNAYLAARRAEHAKQVKNYIRLETKLEREEGELRLIAPDQSTTHFEALLGWKRHQLQTTGLFNYLEAPRIRAFLELARDRRDEEGLQGLLLTLTLNGKPIAGHFGVKLGEIFHPWIAAYDPAFARWSPGLMLIRRAIQLMPSLGLSVYELGSGHAHYKKLYASRVRSLGAGVVFGGGWSGARERASEAVCQSLEKLPGARISSAIQRMRRRADVIASAEVKASRRVSAFADALMRRSFASSASGGSGHDA